MIAPRPALATALICLCFPAMPSKGQEWPRFRGANGSGQGKAKGLPAKVTIADYQWIIELQGVGHSSPVLWGDDLFLTLTDKKDQQKRHLVCFDAVKGKVKWKWSAPFEPHHQHRFNDFSSSTPAVDGERIYLFWGSGERTLAVAVDHSGKKAWQVEFPGFTSDHGTATSPILVEGKVIVQTGHKEEGRSAIIALDSASGKEVWRYDRKNKEGEEEKSAYSTSVVYRGKDGKNQVLAVNSTHGFISLDAQTGGLLWQYNPGFKQRSVGSIAISGDVVLATLGSGTGGKECVALQPGTGGGEAKKLYQLERKGLPYVPTPLGYGGMFFLWGDGGVLSCVKAATGKLLNQKRVAEGTFFSSPIVADGKIFCGSRNGKMVVVSASEKLEHLGTSEMGSGIHATPAVANGRMYIRTNSHLICVGGRK